MSGRRRPLEKAGRHELAYWYGRPDGPLIRLRCRVLGHKWETCHDRCCDGQREWCERCYAVRGEDA